MNENDADNPIVQLANLMSEGRRRKREGRPRGGDPGAPTGDTPTIRVRPGELPRVADEAEAAAMRGGTPPWYSYSEQLVTPVWNEIHVSDGEVDRALRLSAVSAAAVYHTFSRAAWFEKWSNTAADYVRCDLPTKAAELYLSQDGRWNVPTLVRIATAPVITNKGRIVDVPGYDAATGILYEPCGVTFPKVAEAPTKDDAARALGMLKRLLRFFRFVGPADLSVALSGILTAVARSAFDNAPLHAFDAPVAGSGKSFLTDVAAVIASGHRAAVTSTGSDKYSENEFEKRLNASVLAGDTIISLDNLEEPLGGQLLNQLLTQREVKIRVFQTLRNVTAPANAMFFANGNNLAVLGDLTRRVLVSRMDPQVERPELERYPFHPVELAARARPMLVHAALTVVKAYMVHGRRERVGELGSFSGWVRTIREPLVWLGEADPVEVQERTRGGDTLLGALRTIISEWSMVMEVGRPVTVRDMIWKAGEAASRGDGREGDEYFANPGWRDALRNVAEERDGVSAKRLGRWLLRNADRWVDGYRIIQTGAKNGSAEWALDVSSERQGTAPGAAGFSAKPLKPFPNENKDLFSPGGGC